ncbi:hypothetical protein [Rhodohalobacter mucosus]|nr:hypothetical protein [Rhodohalobacter mucosus]
MKLLELKIPPAIVFGLIAWLMWWIASMDSGCTSPEKFQFDRKKTL